MIHNLLPDAEREVMRRVQRTRVLALALFFCSGVVVVGCVALVPAYLSARDVYTEEVAHRSTMLPANATSSEHSLLLEKGEELSSRVQRRFGEEDFSATLEQVLAVAPSGVRLDGVSFNRLEKKVSVEGVAHSREDIIFFTNALEHNKHFAEVPSPLASLAKNEDIHFRLTFTVVDH